MTAKLHQIRLGYILKTLYCNDLVVTEKKFPPPLIRARSSPSQLVIKDIELLKKVQETLNSAFCSTPIKLENRRKYAPLTPAGLDRPKLLASSNGFISVEPSFRKTLSQGSLVKGTNISLFGHDKEKMAETTTLPVEEKLSLAKNEAHSRSSPFKREKEKFLKMQQKIGNYSLPLLTPIQSFSRACSAQCLKTSQEFS